MTKVRNPAGPVRLREGARVIYNGSRSDGQDMPALVLKVRMLCGVQSYILRLDDGTPVTTRRSCLREVVAP